MVNNKYRILLVDDEPDILEFLSCILKNEGYEVFVAVNGTQAVQIAKSEIPHLIVLDVVMPEMDGIETCIELKKIEALGKSVIVFYTARNEDYSQIAAFSAGADDYIVKPVRPKVFIARVNSLLKKHLLHSNGHDIVNTGLSTIGMDEIKVDRERYVVLKNGREVILPRKEFELFSLLFSSPQKVFSRIEIFNLVWGCEMISNKRTIDVHVRKLRQKIGARHIRTIKAIGYCFEY